MSAFKYSMEIRWSELDSHYLARVPELPGCLADGASVVEAANNAYEMALEWLETAKAEGRDIPQPILGNARDGFPEIVARKVRSVSYMKEVPELVSSKVSESASESYATKGKAPGGRRSV